MKILPTVMVLITAFPFLDANAESIKVYSTGISGEYISASSGAIDGTAHGAEQDALYGLSCDGEMTNIRIVQSDCSRKYGGSGNYYRRCDATASANCENAPNPNISYGKATSGYYISASSGAVHGNASDAEYKARSKLGTCKHGVSKLEKLVSYCEDQYGGSGNFFTKCWARYMMKCQLPPSESTAKTALEIQSSVQMLPEGNRAKPSSFDGSSMKASAELRISTEREFESKVSGIAAK